MAKSEQLKDSMKGGLNGLISSTMSTKEEKKTVPTEKERDVHCNFVIKKSLHTRMKYMAIDRDMSLKDMVNEAMSEYLEKYEKKR
ncbi:MAG: hypothetical protein ACRCUJ_13860 [Phocaeicola sp.]